MTTRTKLYLALFILLVGFIIYVENSKPKPVNWYPSYAAKHKLPYGTYVVRNELSAVLKVEEIADIRIAPYIYLQDSSKVGTYVFIDQAVNFGEDEFNELLKFVARGNAVFLSTHGANIDTLGLETQKAHTVAFEEKPFFKLFNKNLTRKEFEFDRPLYNTYFTKIDTLNTTALGKTGYFNEVDDRVSEGINFIKLKHGKGHFLIHTFPEAFTNYFVLKNSNRLYTEALLSYIDTSKPILWDNYYKTGKTRIASPMHYLLSSKHLKWAYYIALVGVVFFILFEGKRKQRFIRIIQPLKNQTLTFTRTIANMYYEKSDHKNIAEHKINYLLAYIRTKLYVPTVKINDTFYRYVSSRSGHSQEEVAALFKYVDFVHAQNTITKEQLIKLNSLIENFKTGYNYGGSSK